jgi:hypothetical protein
LKRLDSWFGGGHAQVRSHALGITVPLLLALDAIFLMVGHAGRYGSDGFNVAHFLLLDRYQPVPSPGLYIGTLIVVAILGWSLALGGYSRWLMAALLVVYTYSWSMSMLDSYQHHYFLSWVLVCMLFLAPTRAEDVSARPNASCYDVGFSMLCGTTAILYFWAAVAKMESSWLSGQTLLSLSHIEETLAGPVAVLGRVGIGPERVWSLLAWSIVLIELGICGGYVVAMKRDRATTGFARTVCTWSWVGAMCLHLGAEVIDLKIGWFSFYMIVIGSVSLLPARIVTVLTMPARMLAEGSNRALLAVESRVGRRMAALLGVGAIAWMVLVSRRMGLPGAEDAVLVAIVGLAIGLIVTGNVRKPEALRRAGLLALAVTVAWATLAVSTARFDFYRRLARGLERQGRSGQALAAYIEAERFAPEGESRADRIERLEKAFED